MKKIVNLLIFSGLTFILGSCQKSPSPIEKKVVIQVIVQNSTSETALVTENFLYQLQRNIPPYYEIVVEQASGDTVNSYYSGEASRNTLQELSLQLDKNSTTPEMDIMPSSEETLVKVVQRFSDHFNRANEQNSLERFTNL